MLVYFAPELVFSTFLINYGRCLRHEIATSLKAMVDDRQVCVPHENISSLRSSLSWQ